MRAGTRKIVVLGVMTKIPVAGVVWQTAHFLIGLERLGFDVYYVEAHARTPTMFMEREDDDAEARAAAFLDHVLRHFGLRGRWAYHALHDDGRCYGLSALELKRLYREAELLINLSGGTDPRPGHFETDRLVYVETDPVDIQIELHEGREDTADYLDAHCAHFTYAENYGAPDCGLPVSDRFDFRPTRQPVVFDLWRTPDAPARSELTTIGSWRQPWRNLTLDGEVYYWSKDREFIKFLDLPGRTDQRFELALASYQPEDRRHLESCGWGVRDAGPLSSDFEAYRAYIAGSRGEFTVAKDQNVRLRTGWFSDRSATYLAAGRPVITQDTGFGSALPEGEGLFAFSTVDDAVAAIEALSSDYSRHARAATRIARDYFDAETVLTRLLDGVGVARAGRAFPGGLDLTPASKRPTTLFAETAQAVLAQSLPRPTPAAVEPVASAVVVSFDGLVFTRLCLETMLSAPALDFEVIVVDNNSTDGTREYLQELAARDARVRLVLNDRNRGFAAAANQGLSAARGRVLVLLNHDTIVTPGAIARLGRHLEEPALGLLGPVSNAAATEAEIDAHYRTYQGLVYEAGSRTPGCEVVDVDMLTMFCVALRRDAYARLGPLDERFEIGLFEDDDYSFRARLAGYRVAYAPDVLVHHFAEAAFGNLVSTGERGALFEMNRQRFEQKWGMAWRRHGHRPSAEYAALVERIRQKVNAALPPDARVLVVSKGDDELLALDGRSAMHFPQLGGVYAGHHPADGAEAIAHLEALRGNAADRAEFLLFPKTSLWWLEYYRDLRSYLDQHGVRAVSDEDTCVIYSLGGSN
jgi:GT2 family glycosyltransferase